MLALTGKLMIKDQLTREAAKLVASANQIEQGAFDFQRRAYYLRLGAYGFVLGDIETLGNHARAPPIPVRVRRDVETVPLGGTEEITAYTAATS